MGRSGLLRQEALQGQITWQPNHPPESLGISTLASTEPCRSPVPFQHFHPHYPGPMLWFPWLEGRGDVFTASRKFSSLPRKALKQYLQFWRSHFGLLQPRQPRPAGLMESCQVLAAGNTSWQTGHLLWTIMTSRGLYQSKSPAEPSCQLERDTL